MSLMRYLREDGVRMELQTVMPTPEEMETSERSRWLPEVKRAVLQELAELLSTSPEIRKPGKIFIDLYNREKQWTTALGRGVAFPHVRTKHTRSLVFAIARSVEGIDFGAPDGEPVHFFLCMVAPPYEDKTYLRFVKKLAEAVTYGGLIKRALEAQSAWELIRLVDDLI